MKAAYRTKVHLALPRKTQMYGAEASGKDIHIGRSKQVFIHDTNGQLSRCSIGSKNSNADEELVDQDL